MHLENHRLIEAGLRTFESPNRGAKFAEGFPDTIIIHYTAGKSFESSSNWLCSPKALASAHLVIGRNGEIAQLVPFDTVAWHAGKSSYMGRSGYNRYSIGIELDNAGILTKNGDRFSAWFGGDYRANEVIVATHPLDSKPCFWHRYIESQIDRVIEVCSLLADRYDISHILGHEEIAPKRKRDPGPAFPLDKVRALVLVNERVENGPAESSRSYEMGIVRAGKLNIRSSPSSLSCVVAPPLSRGTKVRVLQQSADWCEVVVETKGWVSRQYVNLF